MTTDARNILKPPVSSNFADRASGRVLIRWRHIAVAGILGTALTIFTASRLTFDPSRVVKHHSLSLAGEGTSFASLAVRLTDDQAAPSTFLPLVKGNDALGARLRLIEAAERSIDLKTFLIKPDRAGGLIWLELFEAAERGVRVRLLFDDVFTTARDDQIAALDAHPNVEIRAFNPLSRRLPYAVNFMLDFSRVNRRMHNKAMIVDGAFAILGGRNIADEYFQIGTDHEFADFDLLMLGDGVDAVSGAFDLYWNDDWAVPLNQIAAGDATPLRKAIAAFRANANTEAFGTYQEAVNSTFLKSLLAGQIALQSGRATVVVDDPDKLRLSPGQGPGAVKDTFYGALAKAEEEVLILTPYFVPGQEGADFIAALSRRGVRVKIVTNSLGSTNHAYVHGGYATYRRQLLAAGVAFHEVRADAPHLVLGLDKPLTMHTKLALIDRRTVFTGSTNIDPRSFLQNSEIGVVIHSKNLAENILGRIGAAIDPYTFTVVERPDGHIQWVYNSAPGSETFHNEPGAGVIARMLAWFAGWLPVESQL